MNRTLLIDGDVLAYIVAARAEQKYDWGDVKTRQADVGQAVKELNNWVEELVQKLQAGSAIIALSDASRNYFRNDFWPTYKAHRTHGETPLLLKQMKQLLRESKWKCIAKPRLEADDVMGILATGNSIDGEPVIVTTDKDLKQIPGFHANPRKLEAGVEYIPHWEADFNFYTQALAGDATDGFPGCPKIGPKKAAKVFRQAREEYLELYPDMETLGTVTPEWLIWKHIVSTYAKAGKDEAFALTQARVARVLRASDYDFDKGEPILWSPQSRP